MSRISAGRPTATIVRLVRLWKVHALLDFLWVTRDSKYFLICLVCDTLLTIAGVTGLLLLAERFDGIGHWSKLQIVFMLGYGTTAHGLVDTCFGYNILFISRRIGRGQHDHTLIQPQPVWMTLVTEGFAPFQGLVTLLPGLALLVWSAGRLPLHVSAAWAGLFTLNLLASCAVLLSFSFLWGSLAFWAPRAAEEICTAAMAFLGELRVFPLNGLGPVATWGLLTVVPVGFIAWYPCQSLLGLDSRAWTQFVTPLAGAVFLALASFVFRLGSRHYARTGSTRYLPWGHRS